MYGTRKPGPDVRNARAVSLNVKIVFVVRSSNITVRESGPRPAVATMVVTRVCMHRSRSTAAPCALVRRSKAVHSRARALVHRDAGVHDGGYPSCCSRSFVRERAAPLAPSSYPRANCRRIGRCGGHRPHRSPAPTALHQKGSGYERGQQQCPPAREGELGERACRCCRPHRLDNSCPTCQPPAAFNLVAYGLQPVDHVGGTSSTHGSIP